MFSTSVLPLLLIFAKTIFCSPLPMEGKKEISTSRTYGPGSSSRTRPCLLSISHSTGPGPEDHYFEDIYTPPAAYRLGPMPLQEREMTQEEIKMVLDNAVPPRSMDDIIKQGIAKGILEKYDLQVINPSIAEFFLSPRAPFDDQLRGREHQIGHPANEQYFQQSIDTVWPKGATLPPEQEKEKANAELTLKGCQQATRYLHKHDDAAIWHEQTGRILLNSRFDPDKAKEMAEKQYHIPKLRYEDDRIKFKKVAKIRYMKDRRYENGCTVHDETTSEEEE